jgi:hypothetical protein
VTSRPYDNSVSRQLLDYGTWGNFTSNCGCMDATPPESIQLTEERWICTNSRVVFRRRQEYSNGNQRSGFAIRPFCSTVFSDNCTLLVSGGVCTMQCPVSVETDSSTLQELW